LYTFQKEISDWAYADIHFVKPPSPNAKPLPLSELKNTAQKTLGSNHAINYVTAYSDPDKAWEFMAYKLGDPDAITFPGSMDYYESAFVNPYTGEVTGTVNYMHDFFVIVKYI